MEAAPTSTSRATHTMPTTTTLLPSYANAETDKIRDAFCAHNYGSLAKLPSELQAGTVLHAKAGAIQENLRAGALSHHKPLQRRGLFHEFEYIPSRYALAEELRRHEGAIARAHEDAISAHKFTCAGTGKRLKFEDQFEDRAWRYPYLDDPFEGAQEQERRLKWLHEAKVIHGAFLPPGVARSSGAPTRRQLRDAVGRVHGALAADWGSANFSVMATSEDHVVVRFELATVDSDRALRAYMNVFCTGHDVPVQFQLRRVVEDWGTAPGDGYAYYVFAPPWVTVRPTHPYFSLHPEERALASSRVSVMSGPATRDKAKAHRLPEPRNTVPNQPSREHNRRYV